MHVSGNDVRVARACPPRKQLNGDNAPLYDNKRTVFVGNLPFDVKVSFFLIVLGLDFTFTILLIW